MAYSHTVSGTGGVSPYGYNVASGALPAGLTLNAATGTINGTPTSTATATFTIRATDTNNCFGSRAYFITPVCPSITVNPASLATATMGSPYSQIVTSSGGTTPHTFSVTAGTLPAGLTLNSVTGAISGTPTASNGAGANLTILALDANGCSGQRAYSLKVCPVMTLAPTTLPSGTWVPPTRSR